MLLFRFVSCQTPHLSLGVEVVNGMRFMEKYVSFNWSSTGITRASEQFKSVTMQAFAFILQVILVAERTKDGLQENPCWFSCESEA
ncbi:hypothetical protein VNO77_18279 [Canavalia gladiata]|uniref:Uncharacterized protein n=1 Tax=Canavalia gladiata TaxID=3824 RepID=A0AAN9LKI6_CANGL